MSSFSFDDPQRLWLLALAIPLAWVGLRWFRSMIIARRLSAVVLRTLLLALIAAMLAGARHVRQTEVLAVVAVLDLSESVQRFSASGPASAERFREYLRLAAAERGPDDLLGIVVFDGRAISAASPSRADALSRSLEPVGMPGSDVAAAIRLASSMIPSDATGRILLFSDGNQTSGDALEAAAELASRSPSAQRSPIPIDVLPVASQLSEEVVLESIDAPPRASAESTITLRAILRSTARSTGLLTLLREGDPIDLNDPATPGPSRRITLEPGRNIELLTIPLPAGRVHRFEAVFEPDRQGEGFVGDTTVVNNRAASFTLTPGRGAVLVVDGVSEGSATGAGATLSRTLTEAGIEVTTIPPRAAPRDMLGWQPYDLIIFQNVPADEIDESQQMLISTHVRDMGAGFVMVGGPQSFGAGMWQGSTLESILPVKLDIPDQVIVPDVAVVFVIDNSGSMNATVLGSTRTQQQIANESTALAISSLDRNDLVGVITFNEFHRVVVPLGANIDPAAAATRVRNISAGGGTTLGPALAEAARQLEAADARNKQIIVLTDGVSTDAETLPELAASIHDRGIRITAISIGDATNDTTLSEVATRGDGAFYAVINPNTLPRIFLRAIRVVRTPLLRLAETPLTMPDSTSPFAAGLPPLPPVLGHVMTRFRDDPTISNPIATSEGEPLLSHWNVGLGQVVAFTSDAHEWLAPWLATPAYRQFWTQLARTAARSPTDSNAELSVEVAGDVLDVTLDAFDRDNRPLDLLTVPATVYFPSGRTRDVVLSQVGPGRYQHTLTTDELGTAIVIARPRLGTTRLPPMLAGASLPIGTELSRLEPDLGLLKQLASITGGRVLDLSTLEPEPLFDRASIEPALTSRPIWPMLLVWALAVYVLDVGTRRIAWDRFISRRFGADVARDMAESVRTRQARAAEALLARRAEQSPGTSVSPVALTEADARKTAEEARQRRIASYQQAAADRHAARMGREGQQAPILRDDPAQTSDATPGDLLEAKRRARKRFEEDAP